MVALSRFAFYMKWLLNLSPMNVPCSWRMRLHFTGCALPTCSPLRLKVMATFPILTVNVWEV